MPSLPKEVAAKEPRCPFCKRWGTINRWQRLEDVSCAAITRMSTGIGELDTLLGGGFVPGCVYLLAGAPGCGKSTLALEVAARKRSLYAVAEESASAVRLRFDRLARRTSELLIGEITAVEDIADLPEGLELVVVDSIHRLRFSGGVGVSRVQRPILHGIELIVRLARESRLVALVVAHVNRDGEASGTMGLEHDVDALLEMARAPTDEDWGWLRVRKNRHGPAPSSVGVRLTEKGLRFADDDAGLVRESAQVVEAQPEAKVVDFAGPDRNSAGSS